MGKAKELSKDLREKVVELYKTGKGYKKISKELRMLISSVQTLIKKLWIADVLGMSYKGTTNLVKIVF